MKGHYLISAIVLTILCLAVPASADDNLTISGQYAVSGSLVDFRDNQFSADMYLVTSDLDIQLKWQLLEQVKLTLLLNHEWARNLETGEQTYQATAKRQYLDVTPWVGTLVRVGRQKLTTGCGVFWNPTDFFNPTHGHLKDHANDDTVEAILVEQYLAGNTLSLTTLPRFDEQYACEVGIERVDMGYQAGINGFASKTEKALGLNFATTIADFGVYTETAIFHNGTDLSWTGLIGANYLFDIFRNGTVRVEYCHDQLPAEQQNFLALSGTYNPTEKIVLSGAVLWEMDKQGVMFIPTAKYLVNDTWEIQVEGLSSVGSKASQYGNSFIKNTYTVSLVRYF